MSIFPSPESRATRGRRESFGVVDDAFLSTEERIRMGG